MEVLGLDIVEKLHDESSGLLFPIMSWQVETGHALQGLCLRSSAQITPCQCPALRCCTSSKLV